MKISSIISRLIKRKVATAVLITASLAAVATFGEGGRKDRSGSGLSFNSRYSNFKPFSLKSGINYRGSYVFNRNANKYIIVNTNVTYQKGNNTYILPLKRKVLLDKVNFRAIPPAK
jgi:hypothetical protein